MFQTYSLACLWIHTHMDTQLWSSNRQWGYDRSWLLVAHPAPLFSPQPLSSSLQGVWVLFGSQLLAVQWQGEVKDGLQVYCVCVFVSWASVFSRLMPKKRQEERKRALKKNNDAWCLIHQEKDWGSPCSEVSWPFASEGFNLGRGFVEITGEVNWNWYDAVRGCSNLICWWIHTWLSLHLLSYISK